MTERKIYNVSTPPFVADPKNIVCLLSDEELKELQLERPDLICTLAENIPEAEQELVEEQIQDENNENNEFEQLQIKGMTLY